MGDMWDFASCTARSWGALGVDHVGTKAQKPNLTCTDGQFGHVGYPAPGGDLPPSRTGSGVDCSQSPEDRRLRGRRCLCRSGRVIPHIQHGANTSGTVYVPVRARHPSNPPSRHATAYMYVISETSPPIHTYFSFPTRDIVTSGGYVGFCLLTCTFMGCARGAPCWH